MTLFRQYLVEIRQAVDGSEWRSRAGTVERDVMREFIAVAELRGTVLISMNMRSIAQRLNVSVSTVHTAIKRLKARGFLKVGRADRLPDRSTTWRLCRPAWAASDAGSRREETVLPSPRTPHPVPLGPSVKEAGRPTAPASLRPSLGAFRDHSGRPRTVGGFSGRLPAVPSGPQCGLKESLIFEQRITEIQTSLTEEHCSELRHSDLDVHVAADAFAGPGGKTRHRVWEALQGGPRTVAALSRSTTLSRSSVRRILKLLERLGLAVQESKTWRASEANLEAAAEALGTAGAGERRRARHGLERTAFRLERWRSVEPQLQIDRATGEVLTQMPDVSPLQVLVDELVTLAVERFESPVVEVRQRPGV